MTLTFLSCVYTVLTQAETRLNAESRLSDVEGP